ncbi:cysteine--tRNA ligase [uncultured Salinisphaera sp.]|uniref:cysteine--tRNA ligase n=1 Tax=uncultured Salinisphaera sp. TaxID=359372 RepID=UPI0032B235E3
MTLSLTNSLGGRKQAFVPITPGRVRMYVCGPTVYNFAHIGNARPAVVFDVLVRVLRRHFAEVTYARNLTDVDDKINAAAAAEGCAIDTVTERYTRAYHEDMAALDVAPPTIEPRVTAHIPDIVALIERLVADGHAYEAESHVLFHVPSFTDYGALSRRSTDDMIAGARVDVAPYKRHPADFVLWKPSTPEQPGWDSPWGRGRPGWHIECSAMIERHLGTPIDIHGGGRDLIFPHHENEIAQGTRANYWVHNGFVTVEGQKMSKSLGNVLLVRDLLEQAPGEAIRYVLLCAHYRQPLDWSADTLQQARRSLDRLYGVLREFAPQIDGADEASDGASYLAEFNAALDDDLNTPAALAELFALARRAQAETEPLVRAARTVALRTAGAQLGLLQQPPAQWFQQTSDASTAPDVATIEALIAEREQARAAHAFDQADALRERLQALGVVLEDRPDRTEWRVALS